MTWSETQKEIDRVFGEYQEKKKMILYRYLLSRNQVKVGDIVESHTMAIKVLHIHVDLQKMCMSYRGIALTKSYQPRRVQGMVEPEILQRYVWKINGEPYIPCPE